MWSTCFQLSVGMRVISPVEILKVSPGGRVTYSDQCWLVGRVDIALGVHGENSGLAAADRPRDDARIGMEVEILTDWPGKFQSEVGVVLMVTSEGEGVLAFTSHIGWDLSEANHVSGEDGEPEIAWLVNWLPCMYGRTWASRTYWKPSSNSMFKVSRQFLRQSEAKVPGPVSTS